MGSIIKCLFILANVLYFGLISACATSPNTPVYFAKDYVPKSFAEVKARMSVEFSFSSAEGKELEKNFMCMKESNIPSKLVPAIDCYAFSDKGFVTIVRRDPEMKWFTVSERVGMFMVRKIYDAALSWNGCPKDTIELYKTFELVKCNSFSTEENYKMNKSQFVMYSFQNSPYKYTSFIYVGELTDKAPFAKEEMLNLQKQIK